MKSIIQFSYFLERRKYCAWIASFFSFKLQSENNTFGTLQKNRGFFIEFYGMFRRTFSLQNCKERRKLKLYIQFFQTPIDLNEKKQIILNGNRYAFEIISQISLYIYLGFIARKYFC